MENLYGGDRNRGKFRPGREKSIKFERPTLLYEQKINQKLLNTSIEVSDFQCFHAKCIIIKGYFHIAEGGVRIIIWVNIRNEIAVVRK